MFAPFLPNLDFSNKVKFFGAKGHSSDFQEQRDYAHSGDTGSVGDC